MDINDVVDAIRQGENEKIEFKRKFAKEPIAETICAMLNTEGGMIIIGVDNDGRIVGVDDLKAVEKITALLHAIDPSPKVEIKKFSLEDRIIYVINVPKSNKLHSYRGRVFIRVGASNRPLSVHEIIEKAAESLFLYFDELPSRAEMEDINTNYVRMYLKRREEIRGVQTKGELLENMKRLKIIVKKGDKFVPSNGGLLFFSDNVNQYLPNAKVRLVWFKDEEMREYVDNREFEGPIWKIVEDVYEYFVRHLKRIGGDIIGWRRIETYEYPLRALREAVINAVTHRNYADLGYIQIFVYPSRIVIRNPGGFPPGVTIEEPIHKPRNPLLAQYMYDMGYIERYGVGIKLIMEECEKHPLVNVKFNIRPFFTEVVFEKKYKESIVDELDKKILELLRRQGPLMSSEIAREVGVSKPTVLKRLNKLMALELVSAEGKGARKRYKAVKIS